MKMCQFRTQEIFDIGKKLFYLVDNTQGDKRRVKRLVVVLPMTGRHGASFSQKRFLYD